jgi:hypothetical protein
MSAEVPLCNTANILFTEWPQSTTFVCTGRQCECCSITSQERGWSGFQHKGTTNTRLHIIKLLLDTHGNSPFPVSEEAGTIKLARFQSVWCLEGGLLLYVIYVHVKRWHNHRKYLRFSTLPGYRDLSFKCCSTFVKHSCDFCTACSIIPDIKRGRLFTSRCYTKFIQIPCILG